MTSPICVLICGTGSSAHVLATVLAAKPEVEVRVLAQTSARAEAWQNQIYAAPMTVLTRGEDDNRGALTAGPVLITSDPQLAARNCDMILFAIPAPLHRQYLVALEPFLEDGCTIVGLPGQSGFEFEVRNVLEEKVDRFILVNFDSLPWVCRTLEFGRCAQISGTKETLVGAVQGDFGNARIPDPISTLQLLLGERPRLEISGHLLGITLRSPNGYSHPPILYGRWKDWDGVPLDQPPMFYRGVDEATAELLEKISEEVVEITRKLMKQYPHIDLSQVVPMHKWDLCCYERDIADKTTLLSALRTNAGYAEITHPMIQLSNGRYIPDFNHRFLSEDVPYGLVVVRSIAEIAGVQTPRIDEVLTWCQQKMGKQYLVNGSLTGLDIVETRCAHRYGFTTPAEILGYQPALSGARAR